MPGPPPIPNAIKRATGNPGERALPDPEDEPTPPPGDTDMPAWLADRPYAVEAWEHYAPLADAMGVLTTADVGALALLCAAFADYRDAWAIVQDEGATYERISDRGGVSQAAHPAVAQMADAWRRASAMLAQFGLTPSARNKVSVPKGDGETDPYAEFDGPKIADGKQVSA